MGERRVDLVLGSSTGGIGAHVRSLAAGLLGSGAEVRVLGPAATEELFGFTALGARFAAVEIGAGVDPIRDGVVVRRLRRLLDADVVHAHGLRAGLVSGLALGPRAAGRTPLVTTWHNALIDRGPRAVLWRRAARLAAQRADVTLGASQDLVDAARRAGSSDSRLGEVAAPALPPALRTRAQVRADLGCEHGPLVVAVGRLHRQKGFDALITAVAGLPARPLTVIAGEGPERGALESLIHHTQARVVLLGRVDGVADLLRAADAVVISSVWEARALVAQEALLAGAPLVATAVGGLPDLLGDAALLVPPGDPAALGDAVDRVLSEPSLAEILRRRGLARAAGWPDEQAVVRSVGDVYDELLARR